MLRVGRIVLLPLVVFACACGGNPPDKEMQQAQGAIDAARAAGADVYARDEYGAAVDALARARDWVDQRDYRQALSSALDSRDRAQNAAKEAGDNKAIARADAEKKLAEATGALAALRTKLPATGSARAPTTVAAARRAAAAADVALQKARAAFAAGDYQAVLTTLPPTIAHLHEELGKLDAATAPSSRRRR